ncbi:MAG: hypothetical protein LBS01_10425 [Prevotellaceae bacterium]|jgi:hypothetical protein|nr:hypothetical protein [Prevotellaceae bacterium]
MPDTSEHNVYIRQLRDLIVDYTAQLTPCTTVVQRYKIMYDCQNHARQYLRKKILISEISATIAKSFGVTTQTLYRSRAAMRCFSLDIKPSKYARKAYNKIYKSINHS